jgi:ATP-dependent Clp protease ATP-binding subunit ClpC
MEPEHNPVQELYDKAIELYKNKEYRGQALELVEKALVLAPDDLALHLLAGWAAHNLHDETLMRHFEYILDHDILYKDTISHDGDPHHFATFLLLHYIVLRNKFENEDPAKAEMLEEKLYSYSTRLLKAGRPVEDLHDYVEVLLHYKKYDDVILIGRYRSGEVTAEEIGLPGLDKINREYEEDITHEVMGAFFTSGRHADGFQWIKRRVEAEPDDGELRILLGEAYTWMGLPEESAKQWILAVRCDSDWVEYVTDKIDTLVNISADPGAPAKYDLWSRINNLAKNLPEEKKELAKQLEVQVFSTIGNPDQEPPSEEFIETKLDAKLPAKYEDHYNAVGRLLLPWNQSPDAAVQVTRAEAARSTEQAERESAALEAARPIKAPDKIEVKIPAGGVDPHVGAITAAFVIERFGVDLTEQARRGKVPPILGREVEVERVIRVLSRMEKNNPALIGEAGVGKTAVVQGLAQRIVSGDVPAVLQGKRVIEMNMGVLVAGTMWRGDFEQRITDVVKEAQANTDIILFIDELHTVMGAGSCAGQNMDAANMLKPALARGDLRLIGATTGQEYSKTIEKDSAMERRFSPIWIKELDEAATLNILKARRTFWETHHSVTIGDDVLKAAIEITAAQLHHRKFPDKAIDLIDESCALLRARVPVAKGESAEQIKAQALTEEHLRQVIAEWTGSGGAGLSSAATPSSESESLPIQETIGEFRKTIAGHDEVLQKLGVLAANLKAGLKEPSLPVILLFYGPTGTGKTETAKALTRVLWPADTDRLLLLNMEDYDDASTLGRLVGVTIGYRRDDEGGILSMRLKRQPYSVVLLKNFHKAHPRVLEFLTGIFKEGSFHDGWGNLVAAGDALFILTADMDRKEASLGFGDRPISEPGRQDSHRIFEELEALGVPKRLRSIVLDSFHFPALTAGQVCQILKLHIQRLAAQPALKHFSLHLSDERIEELANEFLKEPAEKRNLKMLIQRELMRGKEK